jgi:hypothetical protein
VLYGILLNMIPSVMVKAFCTVLGIRPIVPDPIMFPKAALVLTSILLFFLILFTLILILTPIHLFLVLRPVGFVLLIVMMDFVMLLPTPFITLYRSRGRRKSMSERNGPHR